MSTFLDAINKFIGKAEVNSQVTFVGSVTETKNSIVHGSELTGAPGQVVADYQGGTLAASWQEEWLSPTQVRISTSAPHAQSNEDGIARPGGGPYVQRSAIGGRHSVALTRAGFDKIVDREAARLKDGK